jgi:cytidylate kinase
MTLKRIVAIDGTAGSGKSTVVRGVAGRLGLAVLDKGETYRTVALRALERAVPLSEGDKIAALAREVMEGCALVGGSELSFGGRLVSDEIRTPEVSEATSIVSAHSEVRSVLVDYQRRLVPPGGAVVEGRDIGTVVWPRAELKVFLDASPQARTARRVSQHGRPESAVVELHQRDERDASRPVGAMRPAPAAVYIDTSDLSAEEVVNRVVDLMEPAKADRFYWACRDILAGALRAVFRLEIQGRENIPARGSVILAANHRSLLDIPVAGVTTKRKVHFMAKEELFSSKVGGVLVRRLGGFPVKRGRPDRSALQRSLEVLAGGDVLGIFPEGTRRPNNAFEELEDGFAYLALKSGAPIVPVAISGTEAVFPPGRKLPKLVKVRVLVGEPFRLGTPQPGMLPRARIREATEEAQQILGRVMKAIEAQRG